MNNTKEGRIFEEKVENILSNAKNVVSIKRTKSSGSTHSDTDIVITLVNGKQIGIDCKYKHKPSTDRELEKANRQSIATGRDFGIVVRNSSSNSVNYKAEIRLEDLLYLISMIK